MDSQQDGREAPYRQRVAHYAKLELQLAGQDKLLSYARGVVFLLAVAFLVTASTREHAKVFFWIACGLSATLFFTLVVVHDAVMSRLSRQRELRWINEQAIARLGRRWHELRPPMISALPDDQAVANDLDLLGHASIHHFVNQANSPMGVETLRDWLLNPADPSEILRRQEAVAELAPLLDLREELNLRGRMLVSSYTGPRRFVEWAEGKRWLARRPWLKWLSRVLPLLTGLLIVLTIVGRFPPNVGGVAVLVLLGIQLIITTAFCGSIHDVFNRVSSKDGEVRHYEALFELMYEMPVTSAKMKELEYDTTKQTGGVLRGLRALHWVMLLASVRHSALGFVFAYLPGQLFGLWDFHILALLERWQQRYGQDARVWFAALGHFETLASLASLKYDYPEWAFPVIEEGADRVSAQALGHPLLADEVRVANDVVIGPDHTFLLVTGSNMSGKSTLLRSIGVNVALAQAGSAVCAAELTLPPVVVTTSMRIQDSLEEGVSFYLAELQRLKRIVDQSREYEHRSDRRLLYLLDEILLGTNSKERHIAVAHVLGHLLDCGSIGAVSTHDLELATTELLAGSCQPVHFRETLDNGEMTFDYRMRPGVATTTNALKLMEMVGLDPPI